MKKILIIIATVIVTLPAWSQFRPMSNYPSPNAASLGEYGNIPVSMYVGQPNISIPLYELKEGPISVPVSLDYNLSSVKPNRMSGWVGLGWNVSAGGFITRNVRGCYDEKQKSDGTPWGFYGNYSKLQNVNNSSTFQSHYEHFGPIGLNFQHYTGPVATYELMSDEYSFNFGPYSGSFYLNENGGWTVVSDDNIKLEFNPATGFRLLSQLRSSIKDTDTWANESRNRRFFDIFTLITPEGIRYTFGGVNATEYSINYYNRQNSDLIATSWYLSNITSPEGYSVNFEYNAGAPICEIQFASFSSCYYSNSSNSGSFFSGDWLEPEPYADIIDNTNGKKRLAGYLLFPVYLSKITSPLSSVSFHSFYHTSHQETFPYRDFLYWETPESHQSPLDSEGYLPYGQFSTLIRDNTIGDVTTGNLSSYFLWPTLKAITINNNNKTYYMDYSRENRKKLSKITERRGGAELNEFGEYHETSIPEDVNYYDYYNHRIYQFNYNDTEKFTRYIFASTDHWGYYNGGERGTANGSLYLFDNGFYNTKQPTPNLNIAKAETLKEIIYPTGGKTVFDYQLNRYNKIVPENLNSELISETGYAGGLCVSEIKTYDINNKLALRKKYYYNDTRNNNTNGILKARKKYAMTYNYANGNTLSMTSEGGFLTHSPGQTDAHVSYPTVIEEIMDSIGNSAGYTKYKYTSYDVDIWNIKHFDNKYNYAYKLTSGDSYYIPVSSKSMERGKLVSEENFNASGQLVKSVKYKYNKIGVDSIKMPYQEHMIVSRTPRSIGYFGVMNYVYTYRYLVEKKIETFHDPVTNQALQTIETNYSYNPYKLLSETSFTNSDNALMKTEMKYPGDFANTSPYNEMAGKNILTPVIEKTEYKNNVFLQKEGNAYIKWENNIYAPQFIKFQTNMQSVPETRITYHSYDFRGNPLYITKDNAKSSVYLWSYKGQYLVAKIQTGNYTFAQVETAVKFVFSVTSINALSQQARPNETALRNGALQNALPNALVTTYTYEPPIGMASATDPRGVTTYYDYDSLGRLRRTYLREGGNEKIIQKYDYHYTINSNN